MAGLASSALLSDGTLPIPTQAPRRRVFKRQQLLMVPPAMRGSARGWGSRTQRGRGTHAWALPDTCPLPPPCVPPGLSHGSRVHVPGVPLRKRPLLGTQPVLGRVLSLWTGATSAAAGSGKEGRLSTAHSFWGHNGVALHPALYSCSNKHCTPHLTARRSPAQSRAPPGAPCTWGAAGGGVPAEPP